MAKFTKADPVAEDGESCTLELTSLAQKFDLDDGARDNRESLKLRRTPAPSWSSLDNRRSAASRLCLPVVILIALLVILLTQAWIVFILHGRASAMERSCRASAPRIAALVENTPAEPPVAASKSATNAVLLIKAPPNREASPGIDRNSEQSCCCQTAERSAEAKETNVTMENHQAYVESVAQIYTERLKNLESRLAYRDNQIMELLQGIVKEVMNQSRNLSSFSESLVAQDSRLHTLVEQLAVLNSGSNLSAGADDIPCSLAGANCSLHNDHVQIHRKLDDLTTDLLATKNLTRMLVNSQSKCDPLTRHAIAQSSAQMTLLAHSIEKWMANHSDISCDSVALDEPKCPSPYDIQGNGSCYILLTTRTMNWQESAAMCSQLGGYLATVDDRAENLLITAASVNASLERVWIGLQCTVDQCIGSPTHWRWLENEAEPVYDGWADGEPNNRDPVERCVEMRVAISAPEKNWNDLDCSRECHAVCERPFSP